jgi:hypothetical protein
VAVLCPRTPAAHGTDCLAMNPAFAGEIADWLARLLKGAAPR